MALLIVASVFMYNFGKTLLQSLIQLEQFMRY